MTSNANTANSSDQRSALLPGAPGAPGTRGEGAPWHVHLELQPEELEALERTGLTDGGLAWRKGMQGWQPLAAVPRPAELPESSSRWIPQRSLPARGESGRSETAREDSQSASQSQRGPVPPRKPPFKVGRNTPPLLSPVVVPLHPSLAREAGARELGARDAAGNVAAGNEAAHNYAPPLQELLAPPIPGQPIGNPPPSGQRLSGMGLPVGNLPSFEGMPPSLGPGFTGPAFSTSGVSAPSGLTGVGPVAESVPQSGLLRLKGKSKTTWLGAAALLLLSASNGALVSALIWSMRRSETEKSAAFAEQIVAAAREAAVIAARDAVAQSAALSATRAASAANPDDTATNSKNEGGGVTSPEEVPSATSESRVNTRRAARVSVEQLPVVHSSRKAAAVEAKESKPAAAEAKESKGAGEALPVARTGSARSALDAAIAKSQGINLTPPEATPSSDKPSRHARGKANAKVELTEEPATRRGTAPGPADRAAIGSAVSRAAWAASSCGSGAHKGRVSLTFSPSGSVQSVQLVQSFQDGNINACVLRAMGRAHVAPFVGAPVTVTKTISW
ncbi:MAG TPA: hypothetical protein VFQ61_21310 [Polyangiaceae bacterium]|nr:hypothetical protein [Polyangiaceae bacterium]